MIAPSNVTSKTTNTSLDSPRAASIPLDNEAPEDLEPQDVVDVLRTIGVTCFRDEFGQLYADLPFDAPKPHREHWPLSARSKNCCQRLRALLRGRMGWTLRPALLKEAIELLEAIADGQSRDVVLSNRISEHDGTIWLDMADPSWRSIVISKDGWAVTNDGTPRFRRHRHQAPLPEPVKGGQIEELFDLIPAKSEEDRLLLQSWLVSALMSTVTTPILVSVGQAGGSKTTRSLMLRSLIDPSSTGVLGETERTHLLQVMFHHAVPCFDNLGKFDRKDADFFCRAVTGAGFEKRQLYTDMDEVLLHFKRSIIINAIELPTTRADFLDRCLILHVDRIAKFKPRNVIEEEFRNASPKLLGALLDLVVLTLRELPTTEAPTNFRMADFARVGRAVARALKKPESDFDKAYEATIHGQAHETLDDDAFARALVAFLKTKGFEGTARELLDTLKKFAKQTGLAKSVKDWPGSPTWVTPRLMKLAPVLEAAKIRVEQLPRTGSRRALRIFCTTT